MGCLDSLLACLRPSSASPPPPPAAASIALAPLPSSRSPSPSFSSFSSASFPLSRTEHNTHSFGRSHWFPASPGLLLPGGGYRLIAKLGYGTTATVWLARQEGITGPAVETGGSGVGVVGGDGGSGEGNDGAEAADEGADEGADVEYAVIKLMTLEESESDNAELELLEDAMSGNNDTKEPVDLRAAGLRVPKDVLRLGPVQTELGGRNRWYTALVYDPMGPDIYTAVRMTPNRKLGIPKVKCILRQILNQLAALHSTGYAHFDLHNGNVLCRVRDIRRSCEEIAASEQAKPSRFRKFANGAVVYEQKHVEWDLSDDVAIGDFGLSRYVGLESESQYRPVAVSDQRSPEALLFCHVSEKADMWFLGLLAWYLVTGGYLLCDIAKSGTRSNRAYFGWLLAVLGEPGQEVAEWVERERIPSANHISLESWITAGRDESPAPFENLEEALEQEGCIQDAVEKEQFLRFLRRMLTWISHDRAPALELKDDPWLVSNNSNSL